MARWVVLSQTATSKGFAREFGVCHADGSKDTVHLMAAERTGGPKDDAVIPRRVVGRGHDRASARASLEETVTAYDPAGTVVFSR